MPWSAVSPRAGEWAIAIALVALGAVATWCWATIYRWYSLPENRSNTHFAFEKIPGGFDSPILRRTLLLFLAVSLVYAVGFWLIRRARRLSTVAKLGTVVLIAGPAVVNVWIYPVGALDVFNYMIELKLAYHYEQNPYLVTFAAYRADPFALPAFLVDVPLFYGPIWLVLSGLPALLVGYDDFVDLLVALKVFNLAMLGLTAWAIAAYQEDRSRRWLAAYLFLANPLVLFEGVANAHNDVMMTLFLVAALLALRRRSWAALPLLALSALVKFFTAVLAPVVLLVMALRRWGWQRVAGSLLVSGVVVAAAVAPYWADGQMIDGLKRGTLESQEMDHVSPYSLTQQYLREQQTGDRAASAALAPGWRVNLVPGLPQLSEETKAALRRGFAALFAACALIVMLTVAGGRAPERAVVDLLLLFSLLLTNLYPWYLIPVFAVLALRIDRLGLAYVFAATALGLAYYPMYVYAHFGTEWPTFKVHQFLALFLTVPILAFLALEVAQLGLWAARRAFAR